MAECGVDDVTKRVNITTTSGAGDDLEPLLLNRTAGLGYMCIDQRSLARGNCGDAQLGWAHLTQTSAVLLRSFTLGSIYLCIRDGIRILEPDGRTVGQRSARRRAACRRAAKSAKLSGEMIHLVTRSRYTPDRPAQHHEPARICEVRPRRPFGCITSVMGLRGLFVSSVSSV